MASDNREVRSGGEGDEPTPEFGQGRIVEYDSNRVMNDSTSNKIVILSHEGTDAADWPGQGVCVRQCLACDLKTPQKAPNKAKLESTQSSMNTGFETGTTVLAGRERSQNPGGTIPCRGRRKRGTRPGLS